jgi:glycosyltransferase involved in cell wall biosynthesis
MIIRNPDITVLMPVYNDEKFVRYSIESILNQTFQNYEFIIINDASTDGTLDILNEYKKQDHRIIVESNKDNLRVPRTLNKGLNLARGKYIARIDSDDISGKKRFEKQVLFLENNKGFGMVGSYAEVIDEEDKTIDFLHEYSEPEFIFYTLSFWNCFVTSSVMFEKKLAIESGGFDPNFDRTEDYEMWYKISRLKKVYIIPEYLSKYRKNKSGVTAKYSAEQLRNAENIPIMKTKISKELLKYLKSEKIPSAFGEKLDLIFQLRKANRRILNEGLYINLDKKRLIKIASQRVWSFVKRDFINYKLRKSLKKSWQFMMKRNSIYNVY